MRLHLSNKWGVVVSDRKEFLEGCLLAIYNTVKTDWQKVEGDIGEEAAHRVTCVSPDKRLFCFVT